LPLDTILSFIHNKFSDGSSDDQILKEVLDLAATEGLDLSEEQWKIQIAFVKTAHDAGEAPPVCLPPESPTCTAQYAPAQPVMDEYAVKRAADEKWGSVDNHTQIDLKLDNQTDLSVVLKFYNKHYRRVMYINKLDDPWLVWDGKRWQKGEELVFQMFITLLEELLTRANGISDEAIQKQAVKWVKMMMCDARIRSLMRMLSCIAEIPREAQDLDTMTHQINLRNGQYDLRTFTLRPHYQYDYHTKIIDINYSEDATAPLWNKFLCEILPNMEVRQFLQRCLGYALTGDTSEPALFVLQGKGSNGKTVLLDVIRALMGDYAQVASPALFMEETSSSTKEFQLATLKGARFVSCEEWPENKYFDEAMIKAMTAGAPRSCCYKFKQHFTYKPTDHIFLATNPRPPIRGVEFAIWRRLFLIPFEVTIEGDDVDLHLTTKLIAELPGILTWLIEGYRDYVTRGGLCPPEPILTAREEWMFESNPLAEWMFELCVRTRQVKSGDPTPEADINTLYESYIRWCEFNFIGKKEIMLRKSFARKIGALSGVSRRASHGKYIYVGIGLARPVTTGRLLSE
jgi:putative DNA primase/helicase